MGRRWIAQAQTLTMSLRGRSASSSGMCALQGQGLCQFELANKELSKARGQGVCLREARQGTLGCHTVLLLGRVRSPMSMGADRNSHDFGADGNALS